MLNSERVVDRASSSPRLFVWPWLSSLFIRCIRDNFLQHEAGTCHVHLSPHQEAVSHLSSWLCQSRSRTCSASSVRNHGRCLRRRAKLWLSQTLLNTCGHGSCPADKSRPFMLHYPPFAAEFHFVSAKIRLLPTQEDTLALVNKIVNMGINRLTIHCCTRNMRPRNRALISQVPPQGDRRFYQVSRLQCSDNQKWQLCRF